MAQSNLGLRVISSVVLLPVAFYIIFYASPFILFLALAAIVILSISEFCDITGVGDILNKLVMIAAGTWLFYSLAHQQGNLTLQLGLLFIAVSLFTLFSKGVDLFVGRAGINFFGLLYFPVLLSFVIRVTEYHSGRYWLFFLLLVNWMTDIFAYFVGSTIGRHRLSAISPKKTVEGLIGGIAGGMLAAFAINYFLIKHPAWHYLLLLGAAGSLAGQAGDIMESGIKRCMGVKDSGNIIPGHGGVMDRFDSLYFTAPLFHIFLKYILR